jgi:hypothetical protein
VSPRLTRTSVTDDALFQDVRRPVVVLACRGARRSVTVASCVVADGHERTALHRAPNRVEATDNASIFGALRRCVFVCA